MDERFFIGLMSGTSMDGVDGVVAQVRADGSLRHRADAHQPFDSALRDALFALQQPGDNEIEREALAANQLADVYAQCCRDLLDLTGLGPADITAIGVHGQTIRHRPERGYTRQTNQPARLAELSGIDVIADFRSRDVAAGGQGAPLVPAFHATVFGAPGRIRVICNIGGISNISILQGEDATAGFDCGPGNALMDGWAERYLGLPYDEEGRFAASGRVDPQLLKHLLAEPYFSEMPPKSTGRDLFNMTWLDQCLRPFSGLAPADVQATLTALSAQAIARDIARHARGGGMRCDTVYVCGGGARNPALLKMLEDALVGEDLQSVRVETTDVLGVDPQQVEALAFAWLAMRFVDRQPGNLSTVTGASGPRILGALYPR